MLIGIPNLPVSIYLAHLSSSLRPQDLHGAGTYHGRPSGFTIALSDYEAEKRRLEELGLSVTTATHEWVHWRSLYLEDPDGNEVELVCYDPKA